VIAPSGVEDLLREHAPRALGRLVRRYGRFPACEDAVQEALLEAAVQWPERGVPANPTGWLVTVASRRLVDQVRSDERRRLREEAFDRAEPVRDAPPPDSESFGDRDDTLTLLFLCCHPELSPPSQLALTLRAVGGLTTAEIARAFLVPEATMAQRISRAKQRIRETGARFQAPSPAEWDGRLRVVLHVLYLIFNEGYAATSGPQAARTDLTAEAIRLARAVHRLLPEDGEVAGLLALLLLTDARRPARVGSSGDLIPLAEQDRSRWDRRLIEDGIELITGALCRAPLGPYQLQAAIAAVHAEAPRAEDTDWPQIAALYGLLARIGPSPVVTLNRAVAVAMVEGPAAGHDLLATLDGEPRMAGNHRVTAVRAHLHELAGDRESAAQGYRRAARQTASLPERRYLEGQAARLGAG
jgi:RNA polymerase sigma factor (sigma-70 family)